MVASVSVLHVGWFGCHHSSLFAERILIDGKNLTQKKKTNDTISDNLLAKGRQKRWIPARPWKICSMSMMALANLTSKVCFTASINLNSGLRILLFYGYSKLHKLKSQVDHTFFKMHSCQAIFTLPGKKNNLIFFAGMLCGQKCENKTWKPSSNQEL